MKRVARVVGVLGVWLGLTAAAPAHAGAYRVAEGNTTRFAGALIAGKAGAVLQFQSGLTVRLEPQAECRIYKDSELWLDGNGKLRTESFSLQKGRAEFSRPAGVLPLQGLLIRVGRTLITSTSDGELTAIADDAAGVVATSSGTVSVSSGGKWAALPIGKEAVIHRGSKTVAFADLPAAPHLLRGGRLWLASHGPASVQGFVWQHAGASATYLATVVDRDTGSEKFRQTLNSSEVDALGLSLLAGKYAVALQAIDGHGLAGPKSEPHEFTVVGVEEHNAARVDADGVIHVAQNQPVKFRYVEGLQMTYGSAMPWSPASSSVILRDRERTRIHFRIPQTSETVSAVIEPRGAVADVLVGSKFALWPRDNVRVSVKMHDGSGNPDTSNVAAKIEVRLGIQPLNVTFRADGNRLIADIPPQPGPGPWVLRVTVVDQYGVELGRDFLEVAESAPSTRRAAGVRVATSPQMAEPVNAEAHVAIR